jgi:hypothetical protein
MVSTFPCILWLNGWPCTGGPCFMNTRTRGESCLAAMICAIICGMHGKVFALPDLAIRPMGRTVSLAWKVSDMPGRGVRFLQEGVAHIATDVVYEALQHFITTVLRRLEVMEVPNTPLEDEWKAIAAAEKLF